MKTTVRWKLVVLVILVGGVAMVFARGRSKVEGALPVKFFEQEFFEQGVSLASNKSRFVSDGKIKGAIVPHHLMAGFVISDVFGALKTENPRTVVVIGPNHRNLGEHMLLTADQSWQTPFGILDADAEKIERLLTFGKAGKDREVLVDEHAVAGILPYVKYYLPNARVVPIIFKQPLGEAEVIEFSNILSGVIDRNTIVVAAVDFSHYLPNKIAQDRDKVTWKAIEEFSIVKILGFSNEYLDGPAAMAVFLTAMQQAGGTKIRLLQHTNSGEILKNDFTPSTSYFGVLFLENK